MAFCAVCKKDTTTPLTCELCGLEVCDNKYCSGAFSVHTACIAKTDIGGIPDTSRFYLEANGDDYVIVCALCARKGARRKAEGTVELPDIEAKVQTAATAVLNDLKTALDMTSQA